MAASDRAAGGGAVNVHPTHSFPPDAWLCTRCGERLTSPLAQHPCPERVIYSDDPRAVAEMREPEGNTE